MELVHLNDVQIFYTNLITRTTFLLHNIEGDLVKLISYSITYVICYTRKPALTKYSEVNPVHFYE